MNLRIKVEQLERRAGLKNCPCQTPRLIEYAEADRGSVEGGGCELCGRPLPITEIVAVRPQDDTVC
jgi:hypothetical protein